MTFITRFGTTLLLTAAFMSAPAIAHAQATPATATATTPLPPLVGHQVKIVYRDGRVMYSEVKKQDATTITVGGMPPDRLSDILTIDVAARPMDVGIKGLLVGAVIGVAVTRGHSKAIPIAAGAFGCFLGAAKTIFNPDYEHFTVNQPAQLTLLPTATLHSIGVSGSMRW